MQKLNLYILIALSILILDFLIFGLSEQWIIFDVFIRLAFWLSSIVLIIVGLIVLFYKKRPFKILNLSIAVLGVFLIFGLYEAKDLFQNRNRILLAYYDGDINAMKIELFRDHKYKIDDGSLFGNNIINGKYKISNDTIIMDSKYPLGEDRAFFTNKLLIGDSTINIIDYDTIDKFKPEFKILNNKINETDQ